jgi:hypothetical protein
MSKTLNGHSSRHSTISSASHRCVSVLVAAQVTIDFAGYMLPATFCTIDVGVGGALCTRLKNVALLIPHFHMSRAMAVTKALDSTRRQHYIHACTRRKTTQTYKNLRRSCAANIFSDAMPSDSLTICITQAHARSAPSSVAPAPIASAT